MKSALTAFFCLLNLAFVSACETDNDHRQSASGNDLAHNGSTTDLQPSAAQLQSGSWLTGGGDYQQAYYSPLEQINRKNVAELGYAWHIDLPSEHGYEATPLMVDGVLYGSGPQGIAFAVDAASGQALWQFDPQIDPQFMRKVCCGVVNRGVAVSGGALFVAALDGYLFALNKTDGTVLWRSDTFIDRNRGYTITGAPYIANDLVIIGNAGAEFDARGYITAYDMKTGKQRWRFFTVPNSPSPPFEHPELAGCRSHLGP